MSVILFSAIVYVIGVLFAYRATQSLFSPPMFVLYIWCFALIGGINYYIANQHSLTPIIAGLSAISLGLGSRYVSIIANFRPKQEVRNISPQRLFVGLTNTTALNLALVLSLTLALVSAFIVLRRSPLLIDTAKTELVQPGMGPLARLFTAGLPILSIIWLLRATRMGNLKGLITASLVIIMTMTTLMLTGFKGFVLWFWIFLIVTLGYLKPRGRKVFLATVLGVILGVSSAVVIAYLRPYPCQGSLRAAVFFVWERITIRETLGIDYILHELVPRHGFYYGETMVWDLSSQISELTQGVVFPNPHPSFTDYVADLITGRRGPSNATTMIIGDLYANWGLLGVIAGCFLYGNVLEAIYLAIVRMKKSVISLPFWAYLSFIFIQMASTGSPIGFFLSRFVSLMLVYLVIITSYTFFWFPFMNYSAKARLKDGDIFARS